MRFGLRSLLLQPLLPSLLLLLHRDDLLLRLELELVVERELILQCDRHLHVRLLVLVARDLRLCLAPCLGCRLVAHNLGWLNFAL